MWSVSCSVVSDSLPPPWTATRQAPLSMEFSRQEYWSGQPFLFQGIFLTQWSTQLFCITGRFFNIWPPLILPGLPWWLSMVKCLSIMRQTQFNPWVRKIPWRRKWQPTPVFLPGEVHGQRSLEDYSPQGRKESHTTDRLHFILPGVYRNQACGLTELIKSGKSGAVLSLSILFYLFLSLKFQYVC